MLFQTQFYILLFLPAAAALYYLIAASARLWLLIAASLIFYGWWDVRFVVLPLAQITITWLLALANQRTNRRWPLVLGIVLNLGSLGTFKYLDYAITSLESFCAIALPRANLILPIGISFFSFQLISYLIDRMRHDAPIYPLKAFTLFVLLYPHLIAGPIVRHNELVPQFALDPSRSGLWQRIGAGLVIFTMGLAKKVILADELAKIANPLFEKAVASTLTFSEAWSAALSFTFQLFLDFSAYTEMAIGSALIFGLILPENFNRPYLSTNIREFWRRWHITLSSFLRDYLYIPLGGSRHGILHYIWATLVTMGLCGLWHGAGWTFVVWGLWHAVGLIVCRGWQSLNRPLPSILGWAITMAFVIVGWILFRAQTFASAESILKSLVSPEASGFMIGRSDLTIFAVAAIACIALPSAHEIKNMLLSPRFVLAIGTAFVAAFCVIKVGAGAPAAFIYFQF
jgi:D-alanyl-lipoteichoic acid acyltransferase DltB (MBOAT superfamily)